MGTSKARSDHVRLERDGAWRIVDGWEWLFLILVVGFIIFYILFLLRLNSRR